jgi:hypothetical protein
LEARVPLFNGQRANTIVEFEQCGAPQSQLSRPRLSSDARDSAQLTTEEFL